MRPDLAAQEAAGSDRQLAGATRRLQQALISVRPFGYILYNFGSPAREHLEGCPLRLSPRLKECRMELAERRRVEKKKKGISALRKTAEQS